MLLSVYAHCIDGRERITNRLIEHALRPAAQHRARKQAVPRTAGTRPNAVRHMSVNALPGPVMARNHPVSLARTVVSRHLTRP